jgi:4-hydroxy-3-methylbut-2-enyl diphosphate reductase
VLRINSADEITEPLQGMIGLTAGASAPDEIVNDIIRVLQPKHGVEEIHATDEDEYFPPPRNLRELQDAVALTHSRIVGRPASRQSLADRKIAASAVLAALR